DARAVPRGVGQARARGGGVLSRTVRVLLRRRIAAEVGRQWSGRHARRYRWERDGCWFTFLGVPVGCSAARTTRRGPTCLLNIVLGPASSYWTLAGTGSRRRE